MGQIGLCCGLTGLTAQLFCGPACREKRPVIHLKTEERSVRALGKIFNVSAACDPDLHYMVDITDKLMQIRRMVDAGQYFIINRARQYGKTTTLRELEKILKKDYIVVSLDFQMLGAASFQTENIFSLTFARIFLRAAQRQKEKKRPGMRSKK